MLQLITHHRHGNFLTSVAFWKAVIQLTLAETFVLFSSIKRFSEAMHCLRLAISFCRFFFSSPEENML